MHASEMTKPRIRLRVAELRQLDWAVGMTHTAGGKPSCWSLATYTSQEFHDPELHSSACVCVAELSVQDFVVKLDPKISQEDSKKTSRGTGYGDSGADCTIEHSVVSVSYTHLTLPTTERV